MTEAGCGAETDRPGQDGGTARGGRPEALAQRLATADAATRVLMELAAERGWGAPVRARRLDAPAGPPPDAALEALRPGPRERLAARAVVLVCGRRELSRAENWYVPERLPEAVNRGLDAGDAPFGLLLLPYRPARRLLRLERLWRPGQPEEAAAELFRITAVMAARFGAGGAGPATPVAFVSETYLAGLLA
ncbi:hypothetical protein ACFFJB_06105 [Camelimonas abortus]|uniref:Uncharacterized protein n=1 Tax=Camelimonas abortus TaxID=1017184 RepID=A0ABV7LHV1_9HYPH